MSNIKHFSLYVKSLAICLVIFLDCSAYTKRETAVSVLTFTNLVVAHEQTVVAFVRAFEQAPESLAPIT